MSLQIIAKLYRFETTDSVGNDCRTIKKCLCLNKKILNICIALAYSPSAKN